MPSPNDSQPQHGQGDQQPRQQTGSRRTGGQQRQWMTGQTDSRGMQSQQTGSQNRGPGMQGQQAGMQGQQAQPHSFKDHMTDELRIVLEDFSELSHVAAWCATACASGGPELGTCARICQDIAEIAQLNEMLITRDSVFGPEVAELFLRVADEGLPELRQHRQHHPHIVETIATLERTMNSCGTVLQQGGGRSRMGGRESGSQKRGRQQSERQMQGMREQGRHGQGMSGQPTGGSELTDRRY